MRLGIFAKTFGGIDPHTVLAAVKEAGFALAHYNMACSGLPAMPDAISHGAASEVAAAAAAMGVEIVAVSATYNMAHPDPAARRRGGESLAAIAAAAPLMGARLVTLCTGTRDPHDQWRGHPDNATPEAWRDLLSSMEQAVASAERHGLDLGIEPEGANIVDSAAKARRLIAEIGSSRLKIVLDPANLFETEPPERRRRIVEDTIDQLAGWIVMAHAKDRAPDGAFAAAGHGVIDFPHFLRSLAAAGFDGPLVAHGLSAAQAPGVAGWLGQVLADEGLA